METTINFKLIEERLNKFLDFTKQTNKNLQSLNIGLTLKGNLEYSWFSGTINTSSSIKTTKDTLFGCASITKSFTALLTLILRDEGKLSLDDKLEKYFPEIKNSQLRQINIRSLLGMASGLQQDIVERWDGNDMPFIEQILEEFENNTEPILPIYEKFHYSNIGYTIVGHILSQIAQKAYPDLIKTRIIDKLQMSQSTFKMYEQKNESCEATSYFFNGIQCPKVKYNACAPCGGLMSTINDLKNYLNFMINGNEDIICQNSLQEVMSPTILIAQENLGKIQPLAYGMGWFLGKYEKYNIIFHTGQFQGFISLVLFIKELNFGIIIWNNSDTSQILKIAQRILDIVIPIFQDQQEFDNYQKQQKITKDFNQKIVYEHQLTDFNEKIILYKREGKYDEDYLKMDIKYPEGKKKKGIILEKIAKNKLLYQRDIKLRYLMTDGPKKDEFIYLLESNEAEQICKKIKYSESVYEMKQS